MTTEEIVALETAESDAIHLIRGAHFWRVYNRSAFLFVNFVKEYRVKARFVNKIADHVVYVGFPDESLKSLEEKCARRGFVWNRVDDSRIDILHLPPLTGFDGWKLGHVSNALALPLSPKSVEKVETKKGDLPRFTVLRLYRHCYDLMECVIGAIDNLPKGVRYSQGDHLRMLMVEALEEIYVAANRVTHLERSAVMGMLCRIRINVRMLHSQKCLSNGQWLRINGKIEELLSLLW